MNFDRTEEFFRMFHPSSKTRGNIVLERKLGKTFAQSQISTLDLEKVSRHACGLEDIYFSTASFLGRPLLLNFSNSNCLHLQVPAEDWNTHIILSMRLENKGIPLPTAIIFDGENYTFLWILSASIENHEFYIYSLLQKCLYSAASEFNPTVRNLDTAFLTRMVGSINGKNKKVTGLINNYGKIYSKSFLEKAILDSANISIASYRQLEIQAGITLELMSLLGDRWFSISQNPELFNDWLIFFGSSLCNFCTQESLMYELSAIAESLEAESWGKIKHKYNDLMHSIVSTAKEGFVSHDGIHLSINEPNWRDLIKGKLLITDDEMKCLNLQVLGNKSSISPHLHLQNRSFYPVGQTDFVPIERLLLKNVS